MADDGDAIWLPRDVAALFLVGPKTVTKWTADGRFPYFRTPGGHYRYRESKIRAVHAALEREATTAP